MIEFLNNNSGILMFIVTFCYTLRYLYKLVDKTGLFLIQAKNLKTKEKATV